MAYSVGDGWQLDVDEGPDWLFLRLLRNGSDAAPEPPLAARGWAIADERQKVRLIFELGDGIVMTSHLAGQLILMHKRAEMAGGRFRICGFDEHAYSTLKMIRVAERFPNYASREDAVLGRRADG